MKPAEKMKVDIRPLHGKYYGTEVVIALDNGNEYHFKLWNNADFIPSNRQLAKYDMSLQEWKDEGMSNDGHFESKETYELAVKIKNLIEEAK